MAPKTQRVVKRKDSTIEESTPKKVKTSEPYVMEIEHDCPFISPKKFSVNYIHDNRSLSFSEKLDVVIANAFHTGFEPVKTATTKTGKEFTKQLSITLKGLEVTEGVFEAIRTIVNKISENVFKYTTKLGEPVVFEYQPSYFESAAGYCTSLRIFDSPLYICHAPSSTTALFAYSEAYKNLKANEESAATYFEFEGRRHVFTKKAKTAITECFEGVTSRNCPSFLDGFIFSDHRINVKLTMPDFYLSRPLDACSQDQFVLRTNMFLSEIRVIETDGAANMDNAKWGLRRMVSGSNANSRSLDEYM